MDCLIAEDRFGWVLSRDRPLITSPVQTGLDPWTRLALSLGLSRRMRPIIRDGIGGIDSAPRSSAFINGCIRIRSQWIRTGVFCIPA
jgi:hypothetical protein